MTPKKARQSPAKPIQADVAKVRPRANPGAFGLGTSAPKKPKTPRTAVARYRAKIRKTP